MPKRVYNTRLHFGTETQWLLDRVVETVEEYEEMGFVMTLRQVYYQLVRKALIPNDKHEYNRLKDDIQNAQGDYEGKKDELKRARTAESVAEQQVFLSQLDTASLPHKPIRPILWINATVGGIVALLLALSYGFVADFYDHRFKTVEQAEKYLELPVLGSVHNLGREIIVRK